MAKKTPEGAIINICARTLKVIFGTKFIPKKYPKRDKSPEETIQIRPICIPRLQISDGRVFVEKTVVKGFEPSDMKQTGSYELSKPFGTED